MPALWGKSLTLVYQPATEADARHHRLLRRASSRRPAYLVRLRAVLKVDGVAVATGAAEAPGAGQTLALTANSPGSGRTTVEHVLTVGGVYAFVLDPGVVPGDLIGERHKRLAALSRRRPRRRRSCTSPG